MNNPKFLNLSDNELQDFIDLLGEARLANGVIDAPDGGEEMEARNELYHRQNCS